MTRHKHCEVIKAWAEGAEIQVRHEAGEKWRDVVTESPCFYLTSEYRIKPKTVKREGWVNINSHQSIFATKEDAEAQIFSGCIATVRIEWEEEE